MARVIFSRLTNTHVTARNSVRPYHRHNECSSAYNSVSTSETTYTFNHNAYVLRSCLPTCRQNIAPICCRLNTSSTEANSGCLLTLLRNRLPENHNPLTTVTQRGYLRNADAKIVYGLCKDNLLKLCNCLHSNDCTMENAQVFNHLKHYLTWKLCDEPLADTEPETQCNTNMFTNNLESTFKMYSEIIKILEDSLKPLKKYLDKSSTSIGGQTLEVICDQTFGLAIYSPITKTLLNEPVKYIPALNPDKYIFISKMEKCPSLIQPVKYNMTLKQVKHNPTLEPVKYLPTKKCIAYEDMFRTKYNPTLNQVKHNPTLEPVKYLPTKKCIAYEDMFRTKYNPTLNQVKHNPTLEPVKYLPTKKCITYEDMFRTKYNPTLNQVKYYQTLDSVKYSPTVEPLKYSPTLEPVKYNPTLNQVKYYQTLDSVKYSPTVEPLKYSPTLEPVKYNPTLNQVKYYQTLDSVKYSPTVEPLKYSPTLEPVKYNPTLNQVKHNQTLEPVKYIPTMKPITYEQTWRPRKYDPTQKSVKYGPTMKKCVPALMSTIYGSTFKTSARPPTANHTIFALTSVRGVQSLAPDIPSVTVFDMKRTLKQSGLPLVDGYTALTVKCMLCNAADDGTMYINKTTGSFICPKCQNHGDWAMLQRVLKKGAADESLREHFQRIQEERRAFQLTWKKILEETTPLNKLNVDDAETLFRLFDYPYFEDGPKVLSEVRCDAPRTALVYPLKNSAGAVVGCRTVRAGDERRPESSGRDAAGLFACKLGRSERAVLTPTVPDLLCLARDKVAGCLVWWHAGLLPPSVLPVLENFKRVCIWGGAENIRGVGDKLDHERCRFVRAIDGATTPSEAAAAGVGAGRLRAAVADAAPAAHRSITTFQALRDDVYANLTNAEKVRGVKWSRFPALSRLLGGHRRGELTVLTGATGCGKTTLTAEMSLDLAASGVNTLWGSFEIRNSRLAQTMLQQHAGVPLEEHLRDFHTLADQFQRLPIYFLAFHGPQPIGTVMEAVEHARYVYDIAHVIIDNVQFMLGVGSGGAGGEHIGERFFKQDAVVAAFRTFATRRDCHVTLVMHPRKERDAEDLSTSSIFGSAKASQEADNVLIIQDKRLTAVRGKKYLQVAKNRFSGDLGIVPLEFDKSALSYRAKKRTRDKDDKDGHRADEEGQRQDSEEHRQDDGHRYGSEHRRRGSGEQKDGDGESFLREVLELDKDK